MARRRSNKPKGAKKVVYHLIDKDSDAGKPIYKLMRSLVSEHHEEIGEARIALAWNTAWKPDVDGRVVLGKCKKASDLDRELADFDFIILLRKSFWMDPAVSDEQRTALLDHELCHAQVRCDERTGDPVRDERGRLVFRMRKHDLEEFTEIVRRHGVYKSDIEAFYRALLTQATDFKPCEECRDSPGYVPVNDSGTARVQRCQCWLEWRERAVAAREHQAAAGGVH